MASPSILGGQPLSFRGRHNCTKVSILMLRRNKRIWGPLLLRTDHVAGLGSGKCSLLRPVKTLTSQRRRKKLLTDRCGCGAVHPLSLHPLFWDADLERVRLAPSPPVRTLLSGNPHQAVHHAFVLRLGTDLLGRRLHLQQQLHPLDGGHRGLGHSRCDPACQQVLPEGRGVKEPLFRLLLLLRLRRFTLHGGVMEAKNGQQLWQNKPEKDDEKQAENRLGVLLAGKQRSGCRDISVQGPGSRSCAGASNRLPPLAPAT